MDGEMEGGWSLRTEYEPQEGGAGHRQGLSQAVTECPLLGHTPEGCGPGWARGQGLEGGSRHSARELGSSAEVWQQRRLWKRKIEGEEGRGMTSWQPLSPFLRDVLRQLGGTATCWCRG